MTTSVTDATSTDRREALIIRNVVAGYGQTTVLRDVSVSVPDGLVTVLLGANGAGKTTLMKVVAGLLPATSGSVSLGTDDITGLRASARSARGVCYIPEGRGIFRSLTVRENLCLQVARRREEEGAIEAAVSVFPVLGERLKQTAGTLSGGEQQMLSMVQAYLRDPKVLVVDEPSLGLAPRIVDLIFAFLVSINERGTAVLLVDQFVGRALDIASQMYVMRKGTISYQGTTTGVTEKDLVEHYFAAGSRDIRE